MEASPEFQKALNEACEKQYRGWLYGGEYAKAHSKDTIADTMEEMQRLRRKAVEKTEPMKQKFKGRRRQYETSMRRARAMTPRIIGMIPMPRPEPPKEMTSENIERYREEVDGYTARLRKEAELRTNPHVREIDEAYRRKHGSSSSIVCPVCGEGDQGNRMNGKPYCFMNAKHRGLGPIPLMTPEKAKDWKPPKKKFKRKASWELDDSEVVKIRGKKKRRK